jgi:hypothetical protein
LGQHKQPHFAPGKLAGNGQSYSYGRIEMRPLYGVANTTPTYTASAQPVVIAIQPPLCPFVPLK